MACVRFVLVYTVSAPFSIACFAHQWTTKRTRLHTYTPIPALAHTHAHAQCCEFASSVFFLFFLYFSFLFADVVAIAVDTLVLLLLVQWDSNSFFCCRECFIIIYGELFSFSGCSMLRSTHGVHTRRFSEPNRNSLLSVEWPDTNTE